MNGGERERIRDGKQRGNDKEIKREVAKKRREYERDDERGTFLVPRSPALSLSRNCVYLYKRECARWIKMIKKKKIKERKRERERAMLMK